MFLGKVKFSKIINVHIYKQKKKENPAPFHLGFMHVAMITVWLISASEALVVKPARVNKGRKDLSPTIG